MHCIICGAPAEEIPTASADVISVHCSTCGDYDVSKASQSVLGDWELYERRQALRYAQTNAQPGRRPHLHGLG
ncbi:hypothetical protein [Consotaella aegiceratis]|uniref:hypothetical protein n=1 Tax=Consotaella aegiceratis TaxID=3097961 RepID=UPI002F3FF6FA